MRVFITGGAGYIGTQLVSVLSAKDEVSEIVIYDNLGKSNYNFFIGHNFEHSHKITFVKGELLDSRQLKKYLKGVDIVYHLAAKVTTPFANADPHFFEQVNHWGTAELVYALEESDVKKVVFTSSTSVYGSSKHSVDEITVPNPKTFYGISKLRGEDHVRRLADKVDTYIFRCGNVYGYNKSMRFDAVINKFMFEANFNKRITIHGDGRQHRSYIHVNCAAMVLASAIGNQLDPGTYNLVERDLQVLEIVDVLKEMIPELEFIFVNQHLKLRQLLVKPNLELMNKLGIETNRTLKEELEEFRAKFSF